MSFINPSNAELNLICHLLALLEAHPILHISRIRVKAPVWHLNLWTELLVLLMYKFALLKLQELDINEEGGTVVCVMLRTHFHCVLLNLGTVLKLFMDLFN